MSQAAQVEGFPTESKAKWVTLSEELLLGEKNVGDETRRNLMFQEVRSSHVTGVTQHVQYGTYDGKAACLIVLRFFFGGPYTHFRWINGALITKVSKLESAASATATTPATITTRDPAIVVWAPHRIFGSPIEENRRLTYEVAASLKANVGPVSLGPDAKVSGESSHDREHRMSVIATPGRPKSTNGFENVVWNLKENKKQESAIPRELPIGVIVEYGSPFKMEVTVKATNSWKVPVFASPWQEKDDPLLFNLKDPNIGKTIKGDFEAMTNDDWQTLLGLGKEYEDKIASS